MIVTGSSGVERRRIGLQAVVVALATLAAACSSSSSGSSPSTEGSARSTSSVVVTGPSGSGAVATSSSAAPPTTTAVGSGSASPVVGLVAIGHSALTGENSDPIHPHGDAPQNSWATGTSPDVNSIYSRLVLAEPETNGHVANTAAGGALAQSLPAQARAALAMVAAPQLVIVETIDNDIRCDGTDADHLPEFGASIAEALAVITSASPQSKVLLVGQPGRPSTTFLAEYVAEHPSAQQDLTGTGVCDFFDPSGSMNEEHFATLTAIIDSYEAEENRVCSTVPQCSSDGGVRRQWVDHLDYFSPDGNHLNTLGLAAEAAQMWPVVANVLRLPS